MSKTERKFCGRKAHLYLMLIQPLVFLKKKFRKKMFQKIEGKKIERILVSNWANLGDVVLSTSVLASIKSSYPECKIGFLIAPHTKVIVDNHPLVDFVHVIPNWFLHWQSEPFLKTVAKFFYSSLFIYPKVIKEIKNRNYDCALELYPFFPNTENILWKAKILCRVGFASSSHSHLLSHQVPFPKIDEYLPKTYKHLLKKIGVKETDLSPYLVTNNDSSFENLPKNKYLVFHLGTTDRTREWKIEQWRSLANLFKDQGYDLYFTGRGDREGKIIEEVIHEYPHCKSVCNVLNWDELVQLIKNASLLISVNSVPVHIAAAFKVPFICLYLNTPSLLIWRPVTRNSYALVEGMDSDCEHHKETEENTLFQDEFTAAQVYDRALHAL